MKVRPGVIAALDRGDNPRSITSVNFAGRTVTLSEAIAAATARVAWDRALGRTPEPHLVELASYR